MRSRNNHIVVRVVQVISMALDYVVMVHLGVQVVCDYWGCMRMMHIVVMNIVVVQIMVNVMVQIVMNIVVKIVVELRCYMQMIVVKIGSMQVIVDM